MKKNEKAFNVGDHVTYKSMKNCTRHNGEKGKYHMGGEDHGGFVGEIIYYTDTYVEGKQCWQIHVSSRMGHPYNMLECEFAEYTKPKQDLFPIY